jgi:two-component system CheB/CheR fusion protein
MTKSNTKKQQNIKKKFSQKKVQITPDLGSKNKHDQLYIVALGASAGGLDAFKQFFLHLEKNPNMAYVVISHLDASHTSLLPEIIKQYTKLPVFSIENGTIIQPNTIYVIPSNKNIQIKQNILYLIETISHFPNMPINIFFQSLAEDKKELAIGIILSGTGTDGTLGIGYIKRRQGTVFVQDPSTAKYEGMPLSAINTGIVDFILPPMQIAMELNKYQPIKLLKNIKDTESLQKIFIMLKARTGHDFSAYKLNTISRRIERQMYTHHMEKISNYASFLKKNPKEIDILFKDLLIGVTNFFRDSEAFEYLKNDIWTRIFKNKSDNYCFRAWVPGCSTGEEVYSLAIILRECLEITKRCFNIQIFGTDIDLNALEVARTGVYPESIANDISSTRLKRFFIKENNAYKVKKEIREMVVFGSQNIIKDPPFTKLDLICCRNLLIYLSQDLQKKILPIFHYSLKVKGILFLGTSESIASFTDLFKLIAKKWKIFERKTIENHTHALINFPSISRVSELATIPVQMRSLIENKTDITNTIKKFLLINYAPPCLVVNKKGDILYTHGKTPGYFKKNKEDNSLNLFEIIPKELKSNIKNTIKKTLLTKKEEAKKNILIKTKKGSIPINVRVKPIVDVESISGLTCIIFEDAYSSTDLKNNQTKYNSMSKMNKKILVLEQELQYTKENLQTTIEELQSSNEELQSSNEELQSTNEEIETSKEELQSLNEELVIVNTELQTRIDQLASVNDDMNNLFNSTEISAIFLDNELNIKRFTPKAQDLIHLIQNDIGRSMSHFATNIKYEKLIEDAEEVLKTLIPKSFEVKSKDNNWYIFKILPYRTLANVIDGVVITFSDITAHKEAEKQLKELNNELHNILIVTENVIEFIEAPLVVLTENLKIIKVNKSFCNMFKFSLENILDKYIYEINNKLLNSLQFRKFLEDSILNKMTNDRYSIEYDEFSNGKKIVDIKLRAFSNDSGNTFLILILE